MIFVEHEVYILGKCINFKTMATHLKEIIHRFFYKHHPENTCRGKRCTYGNWNAFVPRFLLRAVHTENRAKNILFTETLYILAGDSG